MTYIYNQTRHLELLKRSQDLKNQGKNLFIESRKEDIELSAYNIAVEEHIFWQERHYLALSMEDFLNRKIDGEELCSRVFGLHRELINACEKFNLDLISGKIKDFQPDEIEHKRFDATLEQALAWKRLEAGIHTQDDIEWIKHECAERHHELKYDSGYSEAHERAQSRYDGYPWENKF